MKLFAGIVVLSEINREWYAFLSKRPLWNSEKGDFESWAGGYQITAVGKMESVDNGNFHQCALREFGEETGLGFLTNLEEVHKTQVFDDYQKVIFMSVIPWPKVILIMQKTHLVPFTLEDMEKVRDMRAYRTDGSFSYEDRAFKPEDGIRMFPDEKVAIIKSLSRFCVLK